jgi:hypothetical protein
VGGYDPFEFLFMLVLFGGGLAIFLYAAFRVIAGDKRDASAPKDDGQTPPSTPRFDLWGIVALVFLIWLFGSLFFGMLGFDTGFH